LDCGETLIEKEELVFLLYPSPSGCISFSNTYILLRFMIPASTMAESKQQDGTTEKMNPEEPTVYDVWKPVDGLFKGEGVAKWITFVSRRKGHDGFVRVVGGDEGFTRDTSKKFYVPKWCDCEVLGCKIMFSKA